MLGVQVEDECVKKFTDMKLRRKYRYLIYMIKDDKAIDIESEGDKDATYEMFLEALPEKEPRYAVVDVPYEMEDGRKQSKLVFFFWSPDSGKVKAKMVYASSKETIKKKLDGLAKDIQANDTSELDYATVVAELKRLQHC